MSSFSSAVNLSISQRIGAEIVRRKRPLPPRQCGVFHHRLEHGLNKCGIEKQKKWRGRINHVDSGDAPVGEIFLGEEHGRAIHVGREAMRRERLAIGEDRKLCVRRSAGFGQIGSELAIEGLTAGEQVRILGFGVDEHLLHRRVIALPVWAQFAAQILNCIPLGVSEQQVPSNGCCRDLAQGKYDAQMRSMIARHPRHVEVVARRQHSRGGKTTQCIGGDGDLRVCRIRHGEMEIAPVDAQIVARAIQNALLA
jgi:hypothetical protein